MSRIRFSRVDPWVPALLFALGTAAAAFAGLMIVAWHTDASTQATAGFERIQYDTAWAIAFCGLTLALHALGMNVAARTGAMIPLLLGSMRLVARIAPGTIAIHPILGNPWLPFASGEYNAMGALSALVAIALGGALESLGSQPTRGAFRSIVVAVLAAIAFALSLLMLFGAWSGSSAATETLQLTGGDSAAACLFLMLSATVLAYALLASETEQIALQRSVPLIIWLAVFACTLVMWRALAGQEAYFVQRSTALVAADARGQIEHDLNARIDNVEHFASRTATYGNDDEAWSRDASGLLQGVAAVRTVTWGGPDYVVRRVVPLDAQASVLGLDRRMDPRRSAAIDLALKTREPTLSPFIDLRYGGDGVAVYAPVFADDQLLGIISATLGQADWFTSILGRRFPDHQIELLQDGRPVRTSATDDAVAGSEWSRALPLAIRNANWSVRATPTLDYVHSSDTAVSTVALAGGALLATLLALSTYFFQTARERARQLNITNGRLVSDIARRYHIEQELRETESRTRQIISAVKDCAIYMLDANGNIASWNPGAQALNGYSAEEIIGRPYTVLYPPDRKTLPEKELTIAARKGWHEEECLHQRKDGTRYSGDDIVSAIRDEPGNLRGFSVVTHDATMRIALREQTERARDFYLSLFSGFPNLVWRSNAEGTCDYLNQAWLDYTGRKLEAEVGNGWLAGVHPDDRPRWREITERTFPTRRPFEIEFRLWRADGSYGWMIGNGRPYYDMPGKFAGYLCSCYDNTARRAMETALKESEARYQGMTANVPGMMFELLRDNAGRLTFGHVSPGCETLIGLPEASLVADASAFFQLIPDAERTHLEATLETSAAQMLNCNWSGRVLPQHESTEKWISIRARPRRVEGGGVLWDGVAFDDTQVRLVQIELERSREELRELSRHLHTAREEEKARIAREVHDELGATLSVLKMDLEWLDVHIPADMRAVREKRSAMIGLIDGAVATTRKIVTDLRPSMLDDLGLPATLRWQVSEYQKRGKLRFHLDVPDSATRFDHERALALFRIFQETVTNVMRHANATNVWVHLGESERAHILTVRDDGSGITDDDLRKPTSHGIRGMRERAQHFGGNMSISSTDDGTTVVVTIPRTAQKG